MRILPAESCDIGELLAELLKAGMIQRYEIEAQCYGAVRNFRKFQRPEKPNAIHPLTDEIRNYVGLRSTSHTASDKKAPPFGGHDPREVGDQSSTKRRTSVENSGQDVHSVAGSHQAIGDQSPTRPRLSGQMEEGGDKRERILSLAPCDPKKVSKPANPRARGDWRQEREFVAFYERYPRKIDPSDAHVAWLKAVRVASPAQIMSGLATYPFKSDREFVPHPATWLNKRAWETEPPTNTALKPSKAPVITASGRALSDADLMQVST